MIKGRYNQVGRPRMKARITLVETSKSISDEFLISTGTPITLIPQELAEEIGWSRPALPPTQFLRSGQPIMGWPTQIQMTLENQDGAQTQKNLTAGIVPGEQWPQEEPPTLGMDMLQGFHANFSPRRGAVELTKIP
jgi:hypothetical protein